MTAHLFTIVDIGGPIRGGSALDYSFRPQKTRSEIIDGVGEASGGVEIMGGEPTLRKDLAKLISGLSDKGFSAVILHTDGIALHRKGVLSRLMDVGLTGIVYRLTSLRSDANDWLMGLPGATKALLKSMRIARELGLPFSAEVVLTRPTLPFVEETVEGLCRLGVERIRIRRLRAKAGAEPLYVSLSPRLSQIKIPLREAETAAYRNRIPFEVSGFPCSLLPRLKDAIVSDARYDLEQKCADADCVSACQGLPMDYGARFGWQEFNSEPVQDKPVVRRLHFHLQESSRRIRKRMVALTVEPVSVLRITGDFRHHSAPQLLKDALRLSIPRLEISGDLRPFLEFSHSQMIAMKQFHRVDACVYGLNSDRHDDYVSQPGAFHQQMTALSRFEGPLKGIVLCLPDIAAVKDMIASTPAYDPLLELSFRLVSPGSSLLELHSIAQEIPGAYGRKMAALLPSCLQSDSDTKSTCRSIDLNWPYAAPHERGPLPGDRLTSFEPCPLCEGSACSGLATAWDATDMINRPLK